MRRASDTRFFRLHAMHVALRNWNSNQKFAARHSVIAFGIRGSNRALIAPKDVHFGPIHLASKFIGGEQFKHLTRRFSARQRDHEMSILGDRLPGIVDEQAGRAARHLAPVGIHVHARKNLLRDAFTYSASVGHRAPAIRRLRAGPRCPPHSSEIWVYEIENNSVWDRPAPMPPLRRRRGQKASRRRARNRLSE